MYGHFIRIQSFRQFKPSKKLLRGRNLDVHGKARDLEAMPLGTCGLFDVKMDLHYTGFRDIITAYGLAKQGAEFREEVCLGL